MPSTIDINNTEKLLTVSIDQDITVETADDIDQRLMNSLQDKYGFNLQLDLSEVAYMDSFGVGWLARLRQYMQSHSGAVWLVNLTPTVRKTLQVTGFLPLFSRPE